MAGRNQDSNTDDLSARKLLFDFYLEEGSRLHQRTDWFLIFHAILLEAYFSDHLLARTQMVVGSLGFVISYLWLVTGIRHRWNFMHLGRCLTAEEIMGQSISSSLGGVFELRNRKMPASALPWARPTSCFGVITPAIFIAAWATLLAMAEFTSKGKLISFGAALAACLLASLVACCLGPGPTIGDEMVNAVAPKACAKESVNATTPTCS
jgi:hypothetical protein